MCTVYVIKSENHNFHYIGHTSNIRQRLHSHNTGKVRSTKYYRPFILIYSEEFLEKSSASRREIYLKSAKGNIWLRNMLSDNGHW
ncbi:MAG: GIY-YIG nuclease family protein [Candidatus Marinimicrobia bacterium]|nr:GIY-YIG nuclease family protein [Candidatus Neomarinimicrobiota bacterium]